MSSEWALRRVRESHLCGYHCGDETAICCCGEIAAALDEARQEGAERERWECHAIAYDLAYRIGGMSGAVAIRIAARGPMRGPEEE